MVALPDGLPPSVEAFRHEHDPLAGTLGAHVTFVFPFASSLSGVQVAAHVRRIAARWPVLPVTLEGVDAYAAQWVHLRVAQGRHAISALHDRLYRGVLAPFLRREFEYEPHVTVGRAGDAPACERMLAQARLAFPRPLAGVLRALAIVAFDEAGRATIEREVALGGGA